MANLSFEQGGFLFDIQPTQKIMDLGLVATECSDADLSRWGRLEAFYIRYMTVEALERTQASERNAA